MTTHLSGLVIDRTSGDDDPIFAPAVLTQKEIDEIPHGDLRAGGIVYNLTVGSLQTYTINGWENIAVSGGGSSTFNNITVNNVATINQANITHDLNVTGNGNLNVTGNGNLNVNKDIVVHGIIYGNRSAGSMFFTGNITPVTFAVSPTWIKIPVDYSTVDLRQFTLINNGLHYTGTQLSPINVLINVSVCIAVSEATLIGLAVVTNGLPSTILVPSYVAAAPGGAIGLSLTNTNLLYNNDYIEIWINSSSPCSVIITSINLTITAI